MSRPRARPKRQGKPPEQAWTPVRVCLAHEVPGRLRLRLADPTAKRDVLEAVIDRIAEVPGITRVRARPNTGSIIVDHHLASLQGPDASIVDILADSGAVEIVTPLKPPPFEQTARLGIAQLDLEISSRTEGTLNLHSALAVALMIGAVVQASRGNIAGPSTALLLSALSLLEQSRK